MTGPQDGFDLLLAALDGAPVDIPVAARIGPADPAALVDRQEYLFAASRLSGGPPVETARMVVARAFAEGQEVNLLRRVLGKFMATNVNTWDKLRKVLRSLPPRTPVWVFPGLPPEREPESSQVIYRVYSDDPEWQGENTQPVPDGSEIVIVVSSIGLKFRDGPGGTQIGTLDAGAELVVFEKTVIGSTTWRKVYRVNGLERIGWAAQQVGAEVYLRPKA